jgi:hypothetical protein
MPVVAAVGAELFVTGMEIPPEADIVMLHVGQLCTSRLKAHPPGAAPERCASQPFMEAACALCHLSSRNAIHMRALRHQLQHPLRCQRLCHQPLTSPRSRQLRLQLRNPHLHQHLTPPSFRPLCPLIHPLRSRHMIPPKILHRFPQLIQLLHQLPSRPQSQQRCPLLRPHPLQLMSPPMLQATLQVSCRPSSQLTLPRMYQHPHQRKRQLRTPLLCLLLQRSPQCLPLTPQLRNPRLHPHASPPRIRLMCRLMPLQKFQHMSPPMCPQTFQHQSQLRPQLLHRHMTPRLCPPLSQPLLQQMNPQLLPVLIRQKCPLPCLQPQMSHLSHPQPPLLKSHPLNQRNPLLNNHHGAHRIHLVSHQPSCLHLILRKSQQHHLQSTPHVSQQLKNQLCYQPLRPQTLPWTPLRTPPESRRWITPLQ